MTLTDSFVIPLKKRIISLVTEIKHNRVLFCVEFNLTSYFKNNYLTHQDSK